MHYFCTIAEQGQISAAARVLHMAQPPLSQRLKELEEELGTELFSRKGRVLELTDAGRILYRRAREILRAVDASKEEVIRASALAGPTLRIGLSPTCRTPWLARFSDLQAGFPDCQIGLVVGDSAYLEHLLLTGQLDAAFMQPPQYPENFVVHSLLVSRTVAVAPIGMFQPGSTQVSLAELSRHRLLLLRRSVGVGGYEQLLRAMHEAGLAPNVALYSSDSSVLLDLLAQGFSGMAIIPESEAGQVGGAFAALPVDIPLVDYQVSLVYPRNGADADLISRLLAPWQTDGAD